MDSNDRERIPEARNELHRILSEVSKLSNTSMLAELASLCIYNCIWKGKEKALRFVPFLQCELSNAVVLVLANKQDLPNAMCATEVADKLALHLLGQRSWYAYGFQFSLCLMYMLAREKGEYLL